MQGKTRGFFEDTAIILVFAGTIYGAYYLYNNSSNDSIILPQSVQLDAKDPNIELSEEKNFFDRNIILVKNIFDDLLPLFLSKKEDLKIIEKKISPVIEEKPYIMEKETPSEVKDSKTIEEKIPLVIEEKPYVIEKETTPEIKEIVESQIKEEKTPLVIEEKPYVIEKETTPEIKEIVESQIIEEIKNKKIVDKNALRVFLRQLKFDIASNIDKSDAQNSNESQKLKIRITVLKDGNYERLHFVDGNKKLFDKHKENILKVLPLNISDSIVAEFPRYVRISIK